MVTEFTNLKKNRTLTLRRCSRCSFPIVGRHQERATLRRVQDLFPGRAGKLSSRSRWGPPGTLDAPGRGTWRRRGDDFGWRGELQSCLPCLRLRSRPRLSTQEVRRCPGSRWMLLSVGMFFLQKKIKFYIS